jgi:hypothetical protein
LKTIIAILIFSVIGWSKTYDPFLLNTQLSLLPKIAMLEKNIAGTKVIKILIAYDRSDEETALSCSQILASKFSGRSVIVNKLPFDKLDTLTSYHLIYALKTNTVQLKKLLSTANTSGAMTALYDTNKLRESGFLLSVQMERTPIILINANALRTNRFSFPDNLLEMVRLVE